MALVVRHDRNAVGAKDPDLVTRDRRDGRAQHGGVIEVDVGEDRHDAVDDVGGVPRAAHADFDDTHVDTLVGKVQECGRREQFEPRQRDTTHRFDVGETLQQT